MKDTDDYLLISGIEHFSFCRRQWALIHIEQLWNENSLTAHGRVIHSRVHENITDIRNGVLTIRGLKIKSDKYHITGVCDAVEFIPSESGIELAGRNGTWKVCPVEYKHGVEKSNDCDRLQVAAQVLCLEEMFSCKIERAAIFYHQSRKREVVCIDDDLRNKLIKMLSEMHDYLQRGYTPKTRMFKGCKNCSLADLCLPKMLKKYQNKSVNNYIQDHITEEFE